MIAHRQWEILPDRFPNIELGVFQIMPNHMHGIISIVGAGLAPAQSNIAPAQSNNATINDASGAGASPAPTTRNTVGNIVGAFKSRVANLCLEIFKQKYPGEIMGKLWQLNYYEHIIREEHAFLQITNYITNNPSKWNEYRFYSA
ncbi:MAG: transposase [Bacteroidota bacterium]